MNTISAGLMKSRLWARPVFCLALVLVVAGLCRADDQSDASIRQSPPALQANLGGTTGVDSEVDSSAAPEQSNLQKKFAMVKTLAKNNNLFYIVKKGGPIMFPLMIASILAVGTVIDRLFFLFIERLRRDKKALTYFFRAISSGDIESAIHISQRSGFYVVRTLGFALTHKEKSLTNALLYAQEQEMKRFRRGIPILDTVITLAPLLGLLGTVTGMMGSFSLIGGELSAPGAITGGIAEALIATAFGLGIAITSLIPFNFLNTRMEEARIEIESAANQLEMLLHPQPNAQVPVKDADI